MIDADVVRPSFPSTPFGVQPELIPAEEFWATEFTPGAPVPATSWPLRMMVVPVEVFIVRSRRSGSRLTDLS